MVVVILLDGFEIREGYFAISFVTDGRGRYQAVSVSRHT